ncbi:hypothetical protein VKT23_019998 [Stygiomarasmius scandens]|uniref:Uncharacterized protein n=1 Tax=Marasmiellus scandens TaxID=2682957 RepID=A0ABR1ILE6_9AGAR
MGWREVTWSSPSVPDAVIDTLPELQWFREQAVRLTSLDHPLPTFCGIELEARRNEFLDEFQALLNEIREVEDYLETAAVKGSKNKLYSMDDARATGECSFTLSRLLTLLGQFRKMRKAFDDILLLSTAALLYLSDRVD